MSLGRHRGATLIGRPLDITVQAVMDAQEDIASLCLDADVFYADNKLDKARVRVTAEKSATGSQDVVIRIRSSNLVDEPVVTLYLRVGCQQKTERRYVTLAELVSDVVPDRNTTSPATPPIQVSPALVTLPASASPTAVLPTTKPARKSRKSADSVNAKSAEAATVPAVIADVINSNSTPKSSGKKQERRGVLLAEGKPDTAKRSRLKLEPLDLSIDRDPQLKASAELLTAPAANPQERSAAAALWQAIAAQPQDILRDTEKLQTLEKSVLSLQAQSLKTQQSVDELGVKLQKAQSERYTNPLVYSLVLFLLLALAGLAYLMWGHFLRRRLAGGDTPWWSKRSESQQSLRNAWADSRGHGDIFESNQEPNSKKGRLDISAKAKLDIPDIDVDFGQSDLRPSKLNSNIGSDSVPPLASKYQPDFALSMTHPSRAVKAEELFDVQQQADFFVSIGQHEQAIEVLRNHIGDGVETSALVYLDLFNLYHQLGRKEDYASLREAFNNRFNTKIPVFEMYTDAGTGAGLEAYQMAMSRIESLWPSPKVLELIEESIFRRPENNAEAFNLEAYRELLMLYSVAKEIISPEPKAKPVTRPQKFDLPETPADYDNSQPMTFMSTSIQPLSASIDEHQDPHTAALTDPLLLSTVPPASLNLGLDLDLSEPMIDHKNALPVDVSDADFFAQFEKEAAAALPTLDVVPRALKKPAEDSGNLIDFDAFDAATGAADKFKPPKP